MSKQPQDIVEAERLRYWIDVIARGDIGEPKIIDESDESITIRFSKKKRIA